MSVRLDRSILICHGLVRAKVIFIATVVGIAFASHHAWGKTIEEMKSADASLEKTVVIGLLSDVFEKKDVDEATIHRYISPDYVQHVDGKTLHYASFLAHIKKQKQVIDSMRFNFISMLHEGKTVFSNHEVSVIKKDGKKLKFKVIAEFTVEHGRIVACDELTHMIEGDTADAELGSRH